MLECVTAGPRRPKKLWELDRTYHCSIIGTCLTLKELGKIGRRAGLRIAAKESDHEIHGRFVGAVNKQDYLSKQVQKTLDTKYRTAVQRFHEARESEVADLWSSSLQGGDVSGPYWAIMTHPSISWDLRNQVYGEVHMLSHLQGASQRVDLKKFDGMKKKCRALEEELGKTRKRSERALKDREDRDVRIKELLERLKESTDVESRLRSALARLNEFENGQVHRCLEDELNRVNRSLDRELRRAADHEENCRQLTETVSALVNRVNELEAGIRVRVSECQALEKQLQCVLERRKNCSENCGGQQCAKLSGRRVLYVGGQSGSVRQFRDLVEQSGGELLHHDGGNEDSRSRLQGLVSRADLVLMPLSRVSHKASECVRRCCRQQRKSFVVLRSSGLSAFASGLQKLAQ